MSEGKPKDAAPKPAEPTERETPDELWTFLRGGSFGNILGILGLLTGLYFWREGIRERDLSFYVSPTRTPILQKGKFDKLTVSYQGNQIEGDLSGAEVQIWNAGKEPIRHSNILDPITIRTVNNEKIYQYTIQTKRDVSAITVTNAVADGVLALDWSILEQHDGARIQIIYNGDVSTRFLVNGVIEGKKPISIISQNTFPYSFRIAIAVFVVNIGVWLIPRLLPENVIERARLNFLVRYPNHYKIVTVVCFLVPTLILSILLGYMTYRLLGPSVPPFNF